MRMYLRYFSFMASTFILTFIPINTYAASYQLFTNIAYSNPAALNMVKKGEMIIGGTTISTRFQFIGSDGPFSGSTTSNRLDFIPYGRFALRLSPQLVAGVDFTQPFFLDIQYPVDSFVRFSSTKTIIRNTDISPRLSYQPFKRLALGAGLNISRLYDANVSFTVPPFGILSNSGTSWAYGFNLGLFYFLTPLTFLNFDYYSKIIHHVGGASTWGPINTHATVDIPFPAVYSLNVIQMLSRQWLISATLRYIEWGTLRYFVFQNTAIGNITIPEHNSNGWAGQLATRYQMNDKLAGLFAFDYETSVQPTAYRAISLPIYSLGVISAGLEYLFAKSLTAKFIYSHGISRPPINKMGNLGPQVGRVNINADLFDFSITYAV